MSERLPYEEQLPPLLRDFPLPDEDAAWLDMKRRLEEEDDDGVIAWWRRGCAGWALALIALAFAGWWFFYRSNTGGDQKSDQDRKAPIVISETGSINDTSKRVTRTGMNIDTGVIHRDSTPVTTDNATPVIIHATDGADTTNNKHTSRLLSTRKAAMTKGVHQQRKNGYWPTRKIATDSTEKIMETQNGEPFHQPGTMAKPDTAVINEARSFIAGDTSTKSKPDSTQELADSTATNTGRKQQKKSSVYFVSAGISLNQQLPVAGQKAVPYAAAGRDFSVADYIPSVYLRFNKKDRWFIQGEFRYGAPQYAKPLVFFQQLDTVGGVNKITEKQVQKTYYHQVPVSFNFNVHPDWTVGAGLIWNRFSKSILQQSVRNAQSPPDSFISKSVIVAKDPDAEGLSKSYFQLLIESQYEWKKFSFGVRYAFGLSPYIRFTLPNEPEQGARNISLQLFVRYQLWKKNVGENK